MKKEIKYIDIFLASSIDDMKYDRIEIGNYIRSLNDRYIDRGIYFRLHMCEDISDEIAKNRKQDEYNELIKQCDYVYVMVWRRLGKYTHEEFTVAREAFKQNPNPKISTFFKEDGSEVEGPVSEFKRELGSQYGHYYTVFSSIDSIKLKILLQMTDNGELSSRLEFKDSELLLDGTPMRAIHLDELPFYHSHKELTRYKSDIEKIEKEIDLAANECSLNNSDEAREKLDDLKSKKNELQGELHKIEMKLLETSTRLVRLESSGEYITLRAKEAMELFEKGRLDEAIAALDDEERRSEYERNKEIGESVKRNHQATLYDIILKIDLQKNYPLTKENADSIIGYYEEARKMVREHDLDPTCVIEFMWFLRDQKDYAYAMEVGEKLYYSLKSKDEVDEALWARFCNDYGVLCRDEEKADQAESLLLEAHEIRKKLAESGDEKHAYDYAITCNSLGILYRMKDQIDKAKEIYAVGLEILRELSNENILIYGGQRANICNNLGYLYLRTKAYDKAEELFFEAYETRNKLEQMQPGAHLIYLGRIHNNLGELCSATGRMSEAEKYMLSGMKLRSKSAEVNPVEKAFVAGSKLSLAVLYSNMGRYEESEKMFLDTLAVYQKYIKKDSKAYTAKFADTKSGLGDLYRKMGRFEDGKRELDEALELYRQLNRDTKDGHCSECARVCIEAGLLYGEMGDHNAAADLFLEACDLLRTSLRANNELYCGIAACAAYNYAVALGLGGMAEDAESELAMLQRKLRKDAAFDKESARVAEKIKNALPDIPKEYEAPFIARLYSM